MTKPLIQIGDITREMTDEEHARYLIDTAPPSPSQNDVIAERNRHLALGFDYTFPDIPGEAPGDPSTPDPRGTHRFATTPSDMEGWEEVTLGANAAMAAGLPDTPFLVVTETGPLQITAAEWQQVLLAATAFRQPIWLASFNLQAMDPIPADLTDDQWWP